MIPSRFNVTVPDFPGSGKYLLYNTVTQAQVVIDDALRAILGELPTLPEKEEARTAVAQLQRMGFLAASESDDTAALENLFKKVWDDHSVIRATVLMTYSCNFRCVYCVEEGVKEPVFMDEKTALEAVEYIEGKLKEYGARKIDVYFYGGEPLLNVPAIRTMARGLSDFCRANNVPFTFGFNTNGALLTSELIAELMPLGLSWARITIDGPKESHDRYRPFKNGKGSFDTVTARLTEACTLMPVDVNINYDQSNVGKVPALLSYLQDVGLAAKIGKVTFTPITPTPKDREGLRPATEMDRAMMTVETAGQLIELSRAALDKGYKVDVGVQARACEMVLRRTSFIIDPRGDLYGCSALAGRKEFRLGNFRGEQKDPFKGLELWRRCAGCVYAPLCGDGCPFGAYIRYGDPLALNCMKETMDYFVRESLKLSYLNKKKAKAEAARVP